MLDPGFLIAYFGIYPDAFGIGLFGAGLRATKDEELDTRWKTAKHIGFYALASGLCAAPASQWLNSRFAPELSADSMRPGIALAIAVFGPYAIKRGIAFFKSKDQG